MCQGDGRAILGLLVYRLKNESAAHSLFTTWPPPLPPPPPPPLSVPPIGGLSGALDSVPRRFVSPQHSVAPGGARRSGGLPFALNRVDILSLPWKAERTPETLGGSRKMRRRGRVESRKEEGGGCIYPVYPVQAITYTCSSMERDNKSSARGLGWRDEGARREKLKKPDKESSRSTERFPDRSPSSSHFN